MDKKFEHKGVWWLPSQPEERVRGTLTFDPLQGPSLDLFGQLPGSDHAGKHKEFQRSDIVLGNDASGEPMTLLDCFESNRSYTAHALYSDNLITTKLSASILIIGQHFNQLDDVRFSKMSFRFSRARDWADVMQVKRAQEERTITLAYTRPETHEINLPNGLALSLDYGVSVVNGFDGASLRKFITWIVEADSERTFEEWWKIQFRIQSFLNLATRHAVHPLEAVQTREITVEYPDGTERQTYHQTRLYWDVVEATEEEETEGGRGMLFVLRDLGTGDEQRANLEKCLQAWFGKAERLETICELYIGTLYKLRPIHRFSNLIQALESYHRGATNQEITLRDRLEQLTTEYEQVLARLLPRKSDFIQKVLDTRNYLTHYDARKKAKAAQGKELYELSQTLQRLVEMCLLREIDIEESRVRHILKRSTNSGWLEKSSD